MLRVNLDKLQCPKHPDHCSTEVFCLETKEFHCELCANEKNIKCESITSAIDKLVGNAGNESTQLKESLEQLSKHKDKLEFESSDDRNPNNISYLIQKARDDIESTFDQLRELIEERKKDLLDELEALNTKIGESYNDEISEINGILDNGRDVLQRYEDIQPGERDKHYLDTLIDLSSLSIKASEELRKCEPKPIVSSRVAFVIEEKEKLIDQFKKIGSISESVEIPIPQSFSVSSKDQKSISLAWSSAAAVVGAGVPAAYRVEMKRDADGNDKWNECYNGSGTSYKCDNLKESTGYSFRIYSVYQGVKSVGVKTCSAQTVKLTQNHVLM